MTCNFVRLDQKRMAIGDEQVLERKPSLTMSTPVEEYLRQHPRDSAGELCAAIERGRESILLVELGMALLRALCRQHAYLQSTGQQLPPPMSADVQPELLLQQLPPAEAVTPATWGEVLRCAGEP